jgi:recombinational DNA repair protein RecT
MALKTCIRRLTKWLPKSITKDIETAFDKEEGQRKFVEAREVSEKQIAGQSAATESEIFEEQQSALPEGEDPFAEE